MVASSSNHVVYAEVMVCVGDAGPPHLIADNAILKQGFSVHIEC